MRLKQIGLFILDNALDEGDSKTKKQEAYSTFR